MQRLTQKMIYPYDVNNNNFHIEYYRDKLVINIFMASIGFNVIRVDTDKGNVNHIMNKKEYLG